MKVRLNGSEKEYADVLKLDDIIEEYSQTHRRIIAEVNGEIIKRDRWAELAIRDGDQIELVSFVGGG